MAGQVLRTISKDEAERARLMSEYKFETDHQSKMIEAERQAERRGFRDAINLIKSRKSPEEALSLYNRNKKSVSRSLLQDIVKPARRSLAGLSGRNALFIILLRLPTPWQPDAPLITLKTAGKFLFCSCPQLKGVQYGWYGYRRKTRS